MTFFILSPLDAKTCPDNFAVPVRYGSSGKMEERVDQLEWTEWALARRCMPKCVLQLHISRKESLCIDCYDFVTAFELSVDE